MKIVEIRGDGPKASNHVYDAVVAALKRIEGMKAHVYYTYVDNTVLTTMSSKLNLGIAQMTFDERRSFVSFIRGLLAESEGTPVMVVDCGKGHGKFTVSVDRQKTYAEAYLLS